MAEPGDIAPWMVTNHADWLEVRNVDAGGNSPTRAVELQSSTDHAEEDITSVVERFKTQHSSLEIRLTGATSKFIEVSLCCFFHARNE